MNLSSQLQRSSPREVHAYEIGDEAIEYSAVHELGRVTAANGGSFVHMQRTGITEQLEETEVDVAGDGVSLSKARAHGQIFESEVAAFFRLHSALLQFAMLSLFAIGGRPCDHKGDR